MEPDALVPPWDLDASPLGRTLMPPAPPPAEGVDWAELPLRAGALLIDLAALSVLTDILGRAVSWAWNEYLFPILADPNPDLGGPRIVQALLVAVPTLLTWLLVGGGVVYLWTVYRATPGQIALGLFTVDVEGRPLLRRPAVVRFLVLGLGWMAAGAASTIYTMAMTIDPFGGQDWFKPATGVLLVFPLVWYALLAVTILRDPRGRGWHDRAAGSVVVRRGGPPS